MIQQITQPALFFILNKSRSVVKLASQYGLQTYNRHNPVLWSRVKWALWNVSFNALTELRLNFYNISSFITTERKLDLMSVQKFLHLQRPTGPKVTGDVRNNKRKCLSASRSNKIKKSNFFNSNAIALIIIIRIWRATKFKVQDSKSCEMVCTRCIQDMSTDILTRKAFPFSP